MTVSSTFNAVLQRSNELDQRLAHRIGRHIDTSVHLLADLSDSLGQKALPCALIPEAPKRRRLTKAFINQIISQNKIKLKGITAAKRLPLAQYVAWMTERGVAVEQIFAEALQAPSFAQLAAYWRAQGKPALP